MRANKARSTNKRLAMEELGKPCTVGGFIFTEEERKFQTAKIAKYIKNSALAGFEEF
jgi:hypothetical protein